jgi:uncharacterized protein YndB with AHSA1/START domain
MTTDVCAEVRIDAPRRTVAAYATDPANDTAWIGALTEVRCLTDPPFGVGSRVARVARFLGRRIEYVNEVVALEPGARLVMRSIKAPFPMTVVYEFEDAGAGTLMRIRTRGDASGFYRLAAPVLARAVRRGVTADLARLKVRLEASGP